MSQFFSHVFKKVPPTQEELDKWEGECKKFDELMKIPRNQRQKEPEKPDPTPDEIEERMLSSMEEHLITILGKKAPNGASFQDLELLVQVDYEFVKTAGTGRNSSTRAARILPTVTRLRTEWVGALARAVAKHKISTEPGSGPERIYGWGADKWGLELIEPEGETDEQKEILKIIPKETISISEILQKSPYGSARTEKILKELYIKQEIICRLASFTEE